MQMALFSFVANTLQVEHPHVTEETAGIDLVIEQLRIAEGLPLLKHPFLGTFFEFRINAEDPAKRFFYHTRFNYNFLSLQALEFV